MTGRIPSRSRLDPWALLAAAVIVGWGTIGPIARRTDLAGTPLAAMRVWIAGGVLVVVVAVRPSLMRAVRSLVRAAPGRSALLGLLLATHWAAMFEAFDRAPVASVLFVVYLAPAGVAVASPRWLGEPVGARTVVALGLGLAGAALVLGPGDGLGAGTLPALYAAASLAMLVVVSRTLARDHGGAAVAVTELAVAGLVLAAAAPFMTWDGVGTGLGWVIVLGVVHTAAGLGLYLAALAHLPAVRVAVLGYLEPASAALLAWWWLEETPGRAAILGGVLIAAAGVLAATAPVPTPARRPRVPR